MFGSATFCTHSNLIQGKTLTTAWVGDSRGVVGRYTPEDGLVAHELTVDHKPMNPDERERILACGGRVEQLMDDVGNPIGPFRVWL